MEKQGFYRWAWLVIFLLGGLLMIYGGAQDVMLFFLPELELVPTWDAALPEVGLICGLIVLTSAMMNIVWGWQLRYAEGVRELSLARRVALASTVGMIADWITGYYGFGSAIGVITGAWLMRRTEA